MAIYKLTDKETNIVVPNLDLFKLIVYRDKNKDWRWHLKAANHKIIAESGEGYKRRQGLYKSLELVRNSIHIEEEETD